MTALPDGIMRAALGELKMTAAPQVPLTAWCVECHSSETQHLLDPGALDGAQEYAPGRWVLHVICPGCVREAEAHDQPGPQAGPKGAL